MSWTRIIHTKPQDIITKLDWIKNNHEQKELTTWE